MIEEKDMVCSFCTKTRDEVKQLITGQNAKTGVHSYICDECVNLCYTRIINK